MASAAPPASRAPSRSGRPADTYTLGPDEALLPVENNLVLMVGIMTASLLQVLDTTIANVALPHMQAALGATPDEISWVLTSYIVASAVAMPITGWLADRVGSRRLFILSVIGFVGASMLCGMAQNLTEMVLFRALQGVSGAFINPLSQAAMVDTNKPSRHAQMMALWGMGIMIGPILGPILGGWLTENWNWRAVFYVNVPIGALSLILLLTLLPSRRKVKRRFDIFGFAMVGIALSSIQLLLDRGNRIDWFDSAEAWIYLGLAISSSWMAIIHLVSADKPLFDRHLFVDRNYTVALLFMAVIGVVMFATMALLPPMLQQLFNYSVVDTGLVLMPRGVGTLISMQLSGLLVRKGVDARYIVGTGLIIAAISLWQMSGWSLAVDRSHVVTSGFIQGLGMGLVFIPLNTMAFATLAPTMRTDGSSLLNLFRSIGSSIGISVASTLLARNIQISHEDLASHVTSSMTNVIDVSTIDRFQMVGTVILSAIDGMVNRQAAMVAYIDDFYMMAWMSFLAIPLVLLMRKAKLTRGGGGDNDAANLPH